MVSIRPSTCADSQSAPSQPASRLMGSSIHGPDQDASACARLGGDAPDVEASAAQRASALDACDLESQLPRLDRSDIASRASANDHHVLLRIGGKAPLLRLRDSARSKPALFASQRRALLQGSAYEDLHLLRANWLSPRESPFFFMGGSTK